MNWKEAYDIWDTTYDSIFDVLSAPVNVENVNIEHSGVGFVYGYDWLANENAKEIKKELISNPDAIFMMKNNNIGAIYMAQMLAESKNGEERAAIWIYATSIRMMKKRGGDFFKCAVDLCEASFEKLKTIFNYRAFEERVFVPDFMIPIEIIDGIKCVDPRVFIRLIQVNSAMLLGAYTILRYSSLDEEEISKMSKKELHSFRF